MVTLLAMAAVLLHATQRSFDLMAGVKGSHLNLSLADLLVGLAFLLWACLRVKRRDFSWPRVTLPALLATAWLGLSLLPSLKGGGGAEIVVSRRGVVEVMQFAEYFLVVFLLFTETFADRVRRRWAVRLLGLACIAALCAAAWQYRDAAVPIFAVRGTGFENRNTFGAFLALVVPLLFGTAVVGRACILPIGFWLVGVPAMCLCLSGGAFLAMCAGMLVAAAVKGVRGILITAALLLIIGGLILPRLSRHNSDVLLDSVALYKESDPYRILDDRVSAAAEHLAGTQQNLYRSIEQKSPVGYADVPSEESCAWKWQQRWKECQAALNMMRASPLFGAGAGSYQDNINRFYGAMPKYADNLMEHDALSGYMVWGASAGAPFLLLLAAMFLRAAARAARVAFHPPWSEDKGVAAGILGSLASLAVLFVFTDPLVRGVGLTVAIILALAECVRGDFEVVASRADA